MTGLFDWLLQRRAAPSPGGSVLGPSVFDGGAPRAASVMPMPGDVTVAATQADPNIQADQLYQQLYGSERFQRDRQQNMLLGAASGLLKAAGPSAIPTSIFSGLGAGIEGAQKGADDTETKQGQRLMLGAQFDTNRMNNDMRKRFMEIMTGGGAAAPGTGAPAGGMPPGGTPTGGAPQAAAGIGAPHPNNPGNLISGPNGFQAFDSPEAGVAALIKNAQAYGAGQNLMQIAGRWAPADDGRTPMLRGNNPQAWAAGVARMMGTDPNQPLDLRNPQTAMAFARAVHAQEKGQTAAYPPEVYQRGAQLAFGGQQQAQAPVRATSPADVAGMPSGTIFTAPDGTIRVKP